MEDSVSNPLEEFPSQVRADVEGLIYLGAISDEVEFCGHSFGLRTLRAGEEMAAALAADPFMKTAKAAEAWASAFAGLALTHVDGDDEFCPQAGPDKKAFARARFAYITDNWFQPTIDHLFACYARLLDRQVEAVRAMQDLSARSLHTSSPSADFLREPGISAEQTLPESQPSQS